MSAKRSYLPLKANRRAYYLLRDPTITFRWTREFNIVAMVPDFDDLARGVNTAYLSGCSGINPATCKTAKTNTNGGPVSNGRQQTYDRKVMYDRTKSVYKTIAFANAPYSWFPFKRS